jgi:hypothetical protein
MLISISNQHRPPNGRTGGDRVCLRSAPASWGKVALRDRRESCISRTKLKSRNSCQLVGKRRDSLLIRR